MFFYYICANKIFMSGDKTYFEANGPELIKRLGITKTEFALRMGIRKQNINTLFKTKNILVIRKAARVLGVPFELLVSYPEEHDFEGCTFFSDYVADSAFLRIVLPYDRKDDLFTIINDCDENLGMDDACEIPLYDEENRQFDFTINLKDNKIKGWHYESGLRIWAKVQNLGTYELQNGDGKPLLQIIGHVPNDIIPPKQTGFGDYVEFCIDSKGTVTNWPTEPDLMVFAEEGTLPKPIRSNKWGRAKQVLQTILNARLSPEELEWIKNNIHSL